MAERTFVIVGASLTGAKAAEGLREEGFGGEVVLIGAEKELPYERPPLSKDYLRGEADDKPYVHDAEWYENNDVELRLGVAVTALDVDAKTVTLDDGESLDYDRLLLATGSVVRQLDIPGTDLDGVHYLRTLAQSDALAARFGEGVRVVVIGSGWIGCEVAASAREKGCEVTIVTPESVPLQRVLGEEVGRIYRDLHAEHGVNFLSLTEAAEIRGEDGKVTAVVTADGLEIDADVVVIGVGVRPATELAEAAGIAVDNGVLVDSSLRTSAADVFAAGDVAGVDHPQYGHRVRVEHWANALAQGAQAARALLDEEVEHEVPYFFSDQYDVGMEYRGLAEDWDEVVFRGDVDAREFIVFWLKDKRLQAGMNVNVWDVNETIRDIILAGERLDTDRLADPDVPLDEFTG